MTDASLDRAHYMMANIITQRDALLEALRIVMHEIDKGDSSAICSNTRAQAIAALALAA